MTEERLTGAPEEPLRKRVLDGRHIRYDVGDSDDICVLVDTEPRQRGLLWTTENPLPEVARLFRLFLDQATDAEVTVKQHNNWTDRVKGVEEARVRLDGVEHGGSVLGFRLEAEIPGIGWVLLDHTWTGTDRGQIRAGGRSMPADFMKPLFGGTADQGLVNSFNEIVANLAPPQELVA